MGGQRSRCKTVGIFKIERESHWETGVEVGMRTATGVSISCHLENNGVFE